MKKIPNDIFFSWVEEALAEGREARFTVHGVSMQPLLRNGKDEVSVRCCTVFRKGDILLFRYHGRYILHRLVRCEEDILVLRGDNAYAEEYCYDGDIVGVVTAVHRRSGSSDVWRSIDPRNPFWRFLAVLNHLKIGVRVRLSRFALLLGMKNRH